MIESVISKTAWSLTGVTQDCWIIHWWPDGLLLLHTLNSAGIQLLGRMLREDSLPYRQGTRPQCTGDGFSWPDKVYVRFIR